MVRLYRKNTDEEERLIISEEWRPLRWPVWRYRIVDHGDGSELERGVAPWTEGIFLSAGPGPKGGTPDLYDVAGSARELLLAAVAVKTKSRESLLAFVSTWGLPLGRALQRSVWETRRALDSLQTHFHWL